MTSRTSGKPDPASDDLPAPEAARGAGERLAIDFIHARGQHLRWILIGGIVGALCIRSLGTLGQVAGVALVAWGLWNAWKFAQTFRFPAGTVVVAGDDVELPRGLCRGAPAKLARADVSAVDFLRRAVPWTQAAPVLVVEAKGEAFVYPRDWFDSESDQRRIIDELTPS